MRAAKRTKQLAQQGRLLANPLACGEQHISEKPAKRFSFRFKLSTFLIFFTIAAVFVRCIVMPEIQRTRTVQNLIADGHDVVLQAPTVTMINGANAGLKMGPTYAPAVAESKWSSTRRSIASLLGIKTTPWTQHLTVKLLGATDADVAMACQLEDLAVLHLFNSDIGEESEKHIANAKNLKTLKLESTKISKSTLSSIVKLPRRVVLHWLSY